MISGVSIFAVIVVWLLILATYFVFRFRRTPLGLPAAPVRLIGAPVTSGLVALFLMAVLVSASFIPGLEPAWQFGLPFFAVVLIVFAMIRKRPRSDSQNLLAPGLNTRQELVAGDVEPRARTYEIVPWLLNHGTFRPE